MYHFKMKQPKQPDFEVEVFKFHVTEPTKKKIMMYSEFLKIKPSKYTFRAYQVGYNLSHK